MIIIPAIDLKDQKCVRLRQGRMDSATVFNEDPVSQARIWEECGAARIHVVDLDGSAGGCPVNLDVVRRLVEAVKVPVQLGGGIRDRETVRLYLDSGINTVILGTIAARNPALTKELIGLFPNRVAVGIDARNGYVAVQGWTESTTVTATDLASRLQEAGPSAFIYTDIEKDGMMQGPNIESTTAFARATRIPVILSGGVSSMNDLERILPLGEFGVSGVIIGRALYEGQIDLKSAIGLVEKRHAG